MPHSHLLVGPTTCKLGVLHQGGKMITSTDLHLLKSFFPKALDDWIEGNIHTHIYL